MPAPLAYFLTWTTYGVRLHGDERGSIDRDHNVPGTPLVEVNPIRVARLRERMSEAPFVLDEQARSVVAQAMRDHAESRGWRLLALNVRSNHAHVVVDCRVVGELVTPEKVMQEFKSWATRRLRSAGLIGQSTRVWTEHGSTRWINDHAGLAAAMDYVERLQDHAER